jgi:hypothetical protein
MIDPHPKGNSSEALVMSKELDEGRDRAYEGRRILCHDFERKVELASCLCDGII